MRTSYLHFAELIGAQGYVQFDKLTVSVRVLDAKSAYGQDRVLITPLDGKGEQWIAADRFVIFAAK